MAIEVDSTVPFAIQSRQAPVFRRADRSQPRFGEGGGKSWLRFCSRMSTCSIARGAPPFAGQVLVEGNRIKAVAPQGAPIAADGAQVVDGGGATLDAGSDRVALAPHLPRHRRTSKAWASCRPRSTRCARPRTPRRLLDQGFTACNSAASAKARLDVVIRNAINAGDIPGPRTLAASPELATTAGLGDVRLRHMHRETFAIVCDGAEEFRKTAREMVREGVDTLKINPSGDEFVPHCARASDRDDRGRDRCGVRSRAHARQARRGPCAQRRVGEALPEARRRGDLSRHAGRRRGLRSARGREGPRVRRAHARHQLHHAERSRQVGHHHAGGREPGHAPRAGHRDQEHEGAEEARRARPAGRRLRLRLESQSAPTRATSSTSSTCSASRRWTRSCPPPSWAARS